MDNDQRIGMVSILVMRQCDCRRRSQFCLTHLGEHVEWFKTTPSLGPCTTRLGEGNGEISSIGENLAQSTTRLGEGNGRRLTKRTPQGVSYAQRL